MKQPKPRVLVSRKILIASLGVATVSYACGGSTSQTSGNLMAPPETGGAVGTAGAGGAIVSSGGSAGTGAGGFTSGNLMPPPPTGGAGGRLNTGGTVAFGGFTSGNLMPPPPTGGARDVLDASTDASSDAANAK